VKNWSRAIAYFRPELPGVFAALGLMLLSIAASVLKPWPVAILIDNILGQKPFPVWLPEAFKTADRTTAIIFSAVAIFVLHSAQGLFSAIQNFISIKAGLRGLARIRNQLFDWMQRLSLAFYQRSNQGDLIYRATWDTYSIQTIFQQGVFKFLNSLLTLALMLIVMWRVNTSLTMIAAAVFPPLIAAMYFFGRKMNKRSLEAHNADSQVSSFVQQNIATLPIVQSYVREEKEKQEFERQVGNTFQKRVRQHGLEVSYWLMIAMLFGMATGALSWWGGKEIMVQRLSIGELVIFLSYMAQLYEPLNQLSQVGATVSDANAGLSRIFEILDSKEIVSEPANPVPLTTREKGLDVAFEGVTFGYSMDQTVLKGISLEVKAGEIIGLIGPSGAGKTTLLNLIPRFYDPLEGCVRVQGKDIREYRVHELRKNIAYVFQESFLLRGSVTENISYGRPEATASEIERAATLANVHEFILRLPNGYDTIVGEGAARLSVGEKQRISIARAFLKDSPILLLDEPTSSLDAETEFTIIQSLAKLMANRTTFIAAHRFTTLQHAHKILVLGSGRIVEIGTPAELLKSGGYYARLKQISQRSA